MKKLLPIALAVTLSACGQEGTFYSCSSKDELVTLEVTDTKLILDETVYVITYNEHGFIHAAKGIHYPVVMGAEGEVNPQPESEIKRIIFNTHTNQLSSWWLGSLNCKETK